MGTYRLGQAARVWVVLLALAAALLPLASGIRVGAQGGTEEPVPATEAPPEGAEAEEPPPDTHIFGYSTSPRFPIVVGFVLNVDVPVDEITAAVLTVSQPTGFERRLAFDPLADYVSDSGPEFTNLRYDWFLLEDTPLTPFETVNYTWQIETTDGVLSSLTDSFVLVDAAAGTWRTTGTAPLTLHSYKSSLAADRVQLDVLAAYDLLMRRTGRSPLFEFVIYEPTADFCARFKDERTGETQSAVVADNLIVYPCTEADYDALYERAGMTPIHRTNASFTELEDMIVAAMARQVYGDLWGDATVPAWFTEGLAGMYGLRPNLSALARARMDIERRTLLDYGALGVEPGEDSDVQVQQSWKAESFLLILYLADRFGADAPFDLARAIPNTEGGFEAALHDLTGTDLAGLWEPFLAWVNSSAADSAAVWTPYLPVTATPTLTPSATPVTPTLTPTITLTPTDTLTPTPPGPPPPTAIVHVASATPQVRPTNTALPPGSLPTLAPTSTASAPAEDTGSDVDPVMIGAIGAVAVLGLLVIVLGIASLRRRSK
jgi:hypothetical protein